MQKIKRLVLFVVWSEVRKQWECQFGGQIVCSYRRAMASKSKAVVTKSGAGVCNYIWVKFGIPTQLVIHKKDGRLQSERTYGYDPKRHKG